MQQRHQNKRQNKHRATLAIKKPSKLCLQNSMLFVASGMLLILGMVLINVPTINRASASCLDGIGTDTEGCANSYASISPEVAVRTSISIALDNTAQMEVIPTSQGAVTTSASTLTVSTNSQDGYAIFLNAKGDGSLKNTTINSGSEKAILSTTSSTTLADMARDSYGYNLAKVGASVNDDTVYLPVVNNTAAVLTTTTPTLLGDNGENYVYGDSYTLSFGVKVGTDLPAGIYSGEILLSAVANPETVRSLAQVEYMQDMQPEICAQTATNYTKRLTDTRDGKQYWVAKLADGKCWMTQNLALDIYNDNGVAKAIPSTVDPSSITSADIATFETLNSINTNLASGTEGIDLDSTNMGMTFAKNYTDYTTGSWNLGEYVLVDPTWGQMCTYLSSDTNGTGSDRYLSIRAGDTLKRCAKVGYLDVSGAEWKPNYQTQNGNWSYQVSKPSDNGITSTTGEVPIGDRITGTVVSTEINYIAGRNDVLIAANTDTKQYDAHYLIGNYYQFNTAVAGNGGEDAPTKTNISTSICPKGWRLPSATVNMDSNNYIMAYKAVYGYDITDANKSAGVPVNVGTGDQSVLLAPMYVSRSGNMRPTAKAFHDAGGYANYFGNVIEGTANYIQGTTISQSRLLSFNNISRGNGSSIRCLAE